MKPFAFNAGLNDLPASVSRSCFVKFRALFRVFRSPGPRPDHGKHEKGTRNTRIKRLGLLIHGSRIAFLFSAALLALAQPAWCQAKAERPRIISRSEWGAKKPVGEGKKHKIEFITIHHTGTNQRADILTTTKMRNLQAFSQRDDKLASGKLKPAWFDIPYHFYIAANGQIAEGRDLKYAGDTNTEYDPTGHALVVLEGSFDKEQPTSGQVDSLKQIVTWLAQKYKVPAANIKGHNDYAKTACPGENLKKLLPEIRTASDNQ
jgi:hypothetical protein